MLFLEPFYSSTERPASPATAHPLLYPVLPPFFPKALFPLPMGLTPQTRPCPGRPYRIPYPFLPPLGPYFDFMDRLWYAPNSTPPPISPKAKDKRLLKIEPKLPKLLLRFFLPYDFFPMKLTTPLHNTFLTQTLPGGWNSDLEKYYYRYTRFQLSCHNSKLHADIPLLLRFTSARRHDSTSFLVASTSWRNTCLTFPSKIWALIPPWTTFPLIPCSRNETYGPLSTSTIKAAIPKSFMITSQSINTEYLFVLPGYAWFPMVTINPGDT